MADHIAIYIQGSASSTHTSYHTVVDCVQQSYALLVTFNTTDVHTTDHVLWSNYSMQSLYCGNTLFLPQHLLHQMMDLEDVH